MVDQPGQPLEGAQAEASSSEPADQPPDEIEFLARGMDAFLEPDLQRILVIDGPAVLGLARLTELDERDAVEVIVAILEAAAAAKRLSVGDPPTMARLISA